MPARRLIIAAALVCLLGAVPSSAFGSSPGFSLSTVLASSPTPWLACPDSVGQDPDHLPDGETETNYNNTEVEPFVAVNPTNPDNIIGVYQQNRWTDGGAEGLVASRSTNGGATWSQNYAEFSECSNLGGTPYTPPFPRATDPWVSFDSAGNAYQISLGLTSAYGTHTDIEVATSPNGGATWSLPKQLIEDDSSIFFNDKQSITGDWRPSVGAGKAYAVWIRGNLPGADNISPVGAAFSYAYSGLPMFSKTTDGGDTWSTPITMTNSNIYIQGNQIVVLPDGTLVDIAATLYKGAGFQPTPTQYFWTAMRSKDGGKTWGAPIKIAPLGTDLLTNPDIPNPETLDETVRAGDYIPDVAVDKTNGDLYVVFANDDGHGFNHVMLTKSTDGGKSWSTPQDVTQTPDGTHSFNGTVEVTDDGVVAVMYYDFRHNTLSAGLPTDVWLTHSHNGGQTWHEQHVYGPFDMENAPVARGWFLGDYQGMAAIKDPGGLDDLLLFFAVATGGNNSADVYAVRANQLP